MTGTFLAIDWGTTNRRVYLIENGRVAYTSRDDSGALRTDDFAAELADIRQNVGDFPALLAGMVGSNVGWKTAPYVPAPAGLAELAANLTHIDARTAIVPGLSIIEPDGRCDIMRGEEVQLLGAVENGMVRSDAVLCQPGTHAKWAWAMNGKITRFVSAMTGELYGLLRSHGLLASHLQSGEDDLEAFRDGVGRGQQRDLAAALFSIRADIMLGRRDPDGAAAFASGLLVGADVAARLKEMENRVIDVLADKQLGDRYVMAIEQLGGSARLVDSHAAFVAGISAIWNRWQ